MKLYSLGSLVKECTNRRVYVCSLTLLTALFFIAFLALFLGSSFFVNGHSVPSRWGMTRAFQNRKPTHCMNECRPPGSEPLPKGIVNRKSNLELTPHHGKEGQMKNSKGLLAIAVGIKQKKIVNQIAKKFPSRDFTIMLFHYDGIVDDWSDLDWSSTALHVSAINQTKWWFAKRFLHPDIVAEYTYIFLWDEDLGVDNFNPNKYISIIEKEGLEISQPALDTAKSDVRQQITARERRGNVHRRIYTRGRCYENSTAPPCTGWVEMMAPVFSRAAWPCVWYMIQNDLIYAWGLDKKFGYCAQGDRSKNVGVVDSEFIVHFGIPTLGSMVENKANEESTSHSSELAPSSSVPHGLCTSTNRCGVRRRSHAELILFEHRWKNATSSDDCWIDPYPQK